MLHVCIAIKCNNFCCAILRHEKNRSSTDLMHALAVGTKCGERRQQLYCHLEETYDCVCLPDGPAGRLLQIEPPNR